MGLQGEAGGQSPGMVGGQHALQLGAEALRGLPACSCLAYRRILEGISCGGQFKGVQRTRQ
ncbi:hypothetical protein D3C77_678750 [compost metagenome]